MSFKVIDYITKKKLGMNILCSTIAKSLESQAKHHGSWKDVTGNARQGLNGGCKNIGSNYSIYLEHGVNYGEILEEGSKPHIIRPKNKKTLYWKGAAHPVKEVHHPGTKGFKTIEQTLNNNKNFIKSTLIKYWSD